MGRVLLVAVFVLVLIAVMLVSAGAVQYSVRDIGAGAAIDINNNGQYLLDNTVKNPDGTTVQLQFNWSGSYYDETEGPYAACINNNGRVWGSVTGLTYNMVTFPTRSCYQLEWNPDGSLATSISSISGYDGYIICDDANDNGVVVGSIQAQNYYDGGGYYQPTYRWAHVSGPNIGFTGPSSNTGSAAIGINNRDEIVGQLTNEIQPESGPSYSETRAWLWRPGLGFTDLGVGSAYEINDNGAIVGSSNNRPIMWGAGFVPIDLGMLAGCTGGAASSINASGIVIGVCRDASYKRHAFYWTSTDGMQALPAPSNVESVAAAINDDGTIAGWTTDAQGQTHAVLWTIPEPTSIVALLCGVGALPLLRRRK